LDKRIVSYNDRYCSLSCLTPLSFSFGNLLFSYLGLFLLIGAGGLEAPVAGDYFRGGSSRSSASADIYDICSTSEQINNF
jgi:hypothetical protein